MEINGRTDSSRKKKKSILSRKESDILTRSIPSTRGESELIRSQIRKTGPLCSAGRKPPVASVSPELEKLKEKEEEEIDLEKQFVEQEDCNWLSSSGCSSPSSFFKEYRSSSPLHLSIDDWLVSWLSTLADSYLHLNEAAKTPKKSEIQEEKVLMELSDSEISGDISELSEPLVWPAYLKSEWSSPETWRCFSMSPRKGTAPDLQGRRRRSSVDRSSDSSCDSIESGFGAMRLNSCRRRLEFRSEPSRLGNRTEGDDEEMGEESIERVVGLGEFDGHEGVDSHFNYDAFSMDDDIDI